MNYYQLAAFPLLCALAGCAGYDGGDLTPGKSTLAEVEKSMGVPADKRAGPDGETVLWYPRLPSGRVSYAATISKDGRLISIDQRLTQANLAKLKVGTSRESDVLDLLGPPNRKDSFSRKDITAWTWQAQGVEPQLMVVEFSPDGVVSSKYMYDDPDMRPLR